MGEDMNDLPPGKDLDWLVAEKVMGWIVDATDHYGVVKAGSRYIVSHVYFQPEWPAFAPSLLIEHAWEVVQYLEGMDRGWTLNLYSQGGCWSASFEDSTPKNICTGRHVGLTAPHAICLAALTVMKITP